MSRPLRQPSPSRRPSSSPGLSSFPWQRVDHHRRLLQEQLDVDAHQRGRDDPEHRERRVAAADLRLARERRPEAALVRERVELRAGVGDRGELSAAAAAQLPEVLEVGARLERRARLRGDDEERPLEIEASLQAAGSPRGACCRGRGTTRPRTCAAAPRARATTRPSRAARTRRTARRRSPRTPRARRHAAACARRRRASRASGPRPCRSRATRRSPRSARRATHAGSELGCASRGSPRAAPRTSRENFCTPSRSSVSTTSS